MNKQYYDILYKLAIKAKNKKNVPVSAIIEKNNKILVKSYNKRHQENNVLSHAEVNCILKASKKLKTWNLSDCILYVSLEPCEMCKKIIESSKIKTVYYILDSKKVINNKIKYIKIKNSSECNFKKLLQNFFYEKR